MYKEIPSPVAKSRCFVLGTLVVIVDNDLLHLSISHKKRYPTWDEIKFARYRFLPENATYAMFFPPKKNYVNVHNNTFHLFFSD